MLPIWTFHCHHVRPKRTKKEKLITNKFFQFNPISKTGIYRTTKTSMLVMSVSFANDRVCDFWSKPRTYWLISDLIPKKSEKLKLFESSIAQIKIYSELNAKKDFWNFPFLSVDSPITKYLDFQGSLKSANISYFQYICLSFQ